MLVYCVGIQFCVGSCILFKIVTILFLLEGREEERWEGGKNASSNTVLTLPGSQSDLHGSMCEQLELDMEQQTRFK